MTTSRRIGLACAVGLGFGITLLCAGFGLLLLHAPTCHAPRADRHRVAAVADALRRFHVIEGRCPRDRYALVEGGYTSPAMFVDRWGTSVVFQCTSEDAIVVRSAGTGNASRRTW